MRTSKESYVYQAIAQATHDHGIGTMFGLMGDANLFMIDHYVRACGGQFIAAAHEGSSVLMALASACVSGKVGVASVTHGPGLTNCVTALIEGVRGSVPMVLLAGDTPVINRKHLQSTHQREIVNFTGAGFEQVRAPETCIQDVGRAFYRARVEQRPIVLNMPSDFMWKKLPYAKAVFEVFDTPSFVREGDALDRAVGMIASAKRPLILAGRGALGARQQISRLGDRLGAPLSTTLKAKGLFTGHAYDIDIFGTLSSPAAYDVISRSDCIICFGASINDFTSERGGLIRDKRLIQIDIDWQAIGKNLHPDVALVADAALMADCIVEWLDLAEIPSSGFTEEVDIRELRMHPTRQVGEENRGFINYIQALEALERSLPHDRLLVTDGGRFMTEVWCRISVATPESFVVTANFGSIGLGLAEAIGACVAAPERPVVLFSGDGGFMMGGINEFNTAVRLKQDLIVIICNDAAYGAEHIQFIDRGMDPGLTEFKWPSFAAVADALGGRGFRVSSIEELETALIAMKNRDRPILIELVLDPNCVPRMRN